MTFASPSSTETGQRTVYTGALVTAAAMAALVALLVIVLLAGPELSATVTDLARGPERALSHVQLLTMLIAGPLLCAFVAALAMWRAIWVMRVTRYMRTLRSYCQERLHRDAPLVALGLLPMSVSLDTSVAEKPAPRPIAEALAEAPQALLLGEAGSGKTTALLTFTRELTSRSLGSRILFGVRGETLPVLVSLPGLAQSLSLDAPSPAPYIASLLTRLGTEGLGARTERLLKAGRITLLCDDYDQLDDDERDLINQVFHLLREPPYSACRLVVACESAAYASVVDDLGPLAHFSAIEVAPISVVELSRALKRRHSSQPRSQEKGDIALNAIGGDIQTRPVGASLRTAAVAAALTETIAAGEGIAWGRAELMRTYLRMASATAAVRDLEAAVSQPDIELSQQPVLVWTALAASLQEARSSFVPLNPSRTVGENVHEWLTNHPPPGPTDFALSVTPELSLPQIERDIQAGLRTGMLRRSLDGLTLSFAHSLAQVSAAAWWLDLRDDGLGRLNSQLLRAHWAAPVVFWAGAQETPYDLAQRIFRFAHSPDSIAPRAGVIDSQDVYPQALALSLAAVIEGATPQLARMIAHQETRFHSFIVTQQGLRDLLDTCVIYSADTARRQRLRRALSRVQREVGDEFVSALGSLAREAQLDRLLRAQITITLGLTATSAAIDELMSLLMQSDPTMRQAVEQALVYAGADAIPALQSSARSGNASTRRRAEEALRLLSGIAPAAGEAAGDAAIAGLNSPDAAQRRVAVTTLSAIGASAALNDLISRLDDINIEVRLAAVQALGQLGGKRALLALRRRATSDDARVRLAVAQALGMDPAPASAPALIRLLKDRDAPVRAAAAASLGAIADKRAIAPLREASEDADPWVRHAAQSAVRRYTRT